MRRLILWRMQARMHARTYVRTHVRMHTHRHIQKDIKHILIARIFSLLFDKCQFVKSKGVVLAEGCVR